MRKIQTFPFAIIIGLTLCTGCAVYPGVGTSVQLSTGLYGPPYYDPFWGPAYPPFYGGYYGSPFGPFFYSRPFYGPPRYFAPRGSYRYAPGWQGRTWSHHR